MIDDTKSHLFFLPTELLLYIFTFLPARNLTKCRQVCLRWKYVIDGLQKSELLWRLYCKKDYNTVYKVARSNARIGVTWFNIYKSLSLWPKLQFARELRDEFCSASRVAEEIMDFTVLRDGIIGVHKKGAIVYYDLETLEVAKRGPITGNYLRYSEIDDTVIILAFQLHLHVIRKIVHGASYEANSSFDGVKTFLLVDRILYFVNLDDEIFTVDLDKERLHNLLLKRCTENIMCLGYSKHCLNILTFERNIYSLVGNELQFVCTLSHNCNLLHILKEYNLLEHLDWRIYFQWMYILNHTVPEGPLQDVIIIRTYGDMVFVGSNWGVLRIYYSPYTDGVFDLYNAEPVKQYNFMERQDCPVLSDRCPIIQIDVIEAEDGHTVIAAMPKKIAVLDFVHSFKRTASFAMLPYRDVQRVKILKIDDSP